MLTTRTLTGMYATLWDRTRECLSSLTLRELPIVGPWTNMDGIGGMARLTAGRWLLGQPKTPLAECRIARITGPFADGLLAFIFPADTERLPTFMAELLAADQRPQLAWLDLRSPGLDPNTREQVTEQTAVLSIRHAPFLPRHEPPPTWAIDFSPGGFLYTRSERRDIYPRLMQAYDDYLNAWIDFAFSELEPGAAADDECPELAAFKHGAIANAGCRDYLCKWFGEDRATRFLRDFLFR